MWESGLIKTLQQSGSKRFPRGSISVLTRNSFSLARSLELELLQEEEGWVVEKRIMCYHHISVSSYSSSESISFQASILMLVLQKTRVFISASVAAQRDRGLFCNKASEEENGWMKHLLFLTQYKAQPDRRSSDGGMWKTQKARFKDRSQAMQNEKDIKETITYFRFCCAVVHRS